MSTTVNNKARRVAAEEVIRHLREYGPNAKVLFVYDTQLGLTEAVHAPETGLMCLFGDEFTAVNYTKQMTHRGGGVVVVTPSHRVANGATQGQLFTMVWTNSLDPKDSQQAVAQQVAQQQAQLGPRAILVSVKGYTE